MGRGLKKGQTDGQNSVDFNIDIDIKENNFVKTQMHKNMNTPSKRIETHFAFRTILIKMTPTVFSLI